jgi:hypothetical protein
MRMKRLVTRKFIFKFFSSDFGFYIILQFDFAIRKMLITFFKTKKYTFGYKICIFRSRLVNVRERSPNDRQRRLSPARSQTVANGRKWSLDDR